MLHFFTQFGLKPTRSFWPSTDELCANSAKCVYLSTAIWPSDPPRDENSTGSQNSDWLLPALCHFAKISSCAGQRTKRDNICPFSRSSARAITEWWSQNSTCVCASTRESERASDVGDRCGDVIRSSVCYSQQSLLSTAAGANQNPGSLAPRLCNSIALFC